MSETSLNEVKRLLEQLTLEEQIAVVEHVARHLHQALQKKQAEDLYGIWRNRFPPDFDLDAALQKIRRANTPDNRLQ